MSINTAGGFTGDPAEAFTPPASSGCCGTTPATPTASTTATSTCCGTTEAATATGSCCDPAAKADAVASGAGCCS
ncbi:hypothetical protein NQK81_35340 [Amycolatopsis roodepoortensis]|uniref:hypothetical protein n=1 Tax=Amycolatopsis roodepoortensis TaxID=700274 RepID=UPI00214B974A|nr:hypothetical protein [Amycolatopsis roodepoortensis]UUV29997.1 hypothetical protein NQK81_35340 [Amycolatopsis roodepoortensis]